MKYYALNYNILDVDYYTHSAGITGYCGKMNIDISFRRLPTGSLVRLIHISDEDVCAMKLMFNGLEFREVDKSTATAGYELDHVH